MLKSNVLKDFVHVAGPYGISHFVMFSKTELSPYMVSQAEIYLKSYSIYKESRNLLNRLWWKSISMQLHYQFIDIFFTNNVSKVKRDADLFEKCETFNSKPENFNCRRHDFYCCSKILICGKLSLVIFFPYLWETWGRKRSRLSLKNASFWQY